MQQSGVLQAESQSLFSRRNKEREMIMIRKGMIADIQRASIHDGPGIRTTVFLKGCPLHCAWCHNPECIHFEPQLMYYPEKCIGCGRCAEGCFAGARVLCGREMTVEAVMKEILQDKTYYEGSGGVTFSGGEPLAQKEYLSALIDACKKEGLHCAIETSLFYFDEEILGKIDLVMADLKIWDGALHKKYTGADNAMIKRHFEMLHMLNAPIVARTPVIPGIEQGIDRISAFLQQFSNVKQYELLPYHPLGEEKYRALKSAAELEKKGFQLPAGEKFEVPTGEKMKELEKYVFLRR